MSCSEAAAAILVEGRLRISFLHKEQVRAAILEGGRALPVGYGGPAGDWWCTCGEEPCRHTKALRRVVEGDVALWEALGQVDQEDLR